MYEISLIVPTFERAASLRTLLNSLQGQTLEHFEVLVIDQSHDQREGVSGVVREARRRGTHLRHFYQSVPNASRARNVGILEASAELLLFLDDDVEVERREFLEAHAKNYDDQDVDGVVGQILSRDRVVRFDRHWMSYRRRVGWLYFPQNYGYRTWVESGRSANLSVRRSIAVSVGGMDERFEKGAHREEADFCSRCLRKGARFIFDPKATVVHHEHPQGGIRQWKEMDGISALHHIVGEMYFILRNVAPRDYCDHLIAMTRRHFLVAAYRRAPWRLVGAVARLVRGFVRARRLVKDGPVYLDSGRRDYVEV